MSEALAYLCVCHKWAHKYARQHADFGDLSQAGFFGLLRAFATYDPSRGTPFLCWADPYVRSYVRQEAVVLRSAVRTGARKGAAVVEPIDPDTPAGFDGFRRVDLADEVAHLLSRLDGGKRRLVEMLYGLNGFRPHTVPEAAAECGVNETALLSRKRVAILQLREVARG